MAASPEQRLIDAIHAARETWVELEPGKRVRLRRPPEDGLLAVRHYKGAREYCQHVTGWEGFTEADLLPAGVGSSDAAPFSLPLWLAVVEDRLEWVGKVSEALMQAITRHLEQREAAAKN